MNSSDSIDSKLKILICEEDNRVLRRLSSWVKAMGDEVYTSDDGIHAQELFNEIRPDIILVSPGLKSMGGIEFIEKVKQAYPSQAIVLMLSSDTDANVFKLSIDLQVDKYLNKPVDATLLFNTIEALSKEKLWHEDYKVQKQLLQDYKDAIDLSFSVTKHDKEGKIFYVNDSFCKTTNLSYEEAMQGVINPLNNENADMEHVWRELNENYIYRDRQTFKFDDKQDHIIDITAVAILDKNNEISEFLVFSNDVSEVVYAARKIKQQDIDQRLQKLEHAKEVNKIKDSFLTVFTHELKTPLNAIINFSEYVNKHLAKEEFKKRDTLVHQVSQINASGWTMLDMITNLIDAMKLKDGMLQLHRTEVTLNNVVDTILKKHAVELEGIKLVKAYKKNYTIHSDELRVKQILNNLITNAIKYSQSTIVIIIKANKEEFVIEVLDDGEGFSDKQNAIKLFEQSGEDDMTRTAKGAGVGLYIVKELCSRLGYKVVITDSKELGGARVLIRGKKDIEL